MSFSIKSAKFTGNPDSSGWTQVYDFKSDDPEKFNLRGHLFALISTSSQGEGLDTVVSGREIFSRLHEEYFGKIYNKPYIALKESVEKVITEFSSLGTIEIVAVSLVDSFLYMAVGGGSSVFLYRQGELYKLIESVSSGTVAASGNLRDKDNIIFATKAFFTSFSHEAIKNSLQGSDPGAVVELFAPLVHSREFEGNYGIVVLRFDTYLQTQEIKHLSSQDKPIQNLPTEKSPVNSEGAFNRIKRKTFGIFRNKGVYIKSEKSEISEKSRKTSLLVGILLLLILTVSIYFGIQQKKNADFKSSYESQLTTAEHELQESYSLLLLNPQRSRELFDQARKKVLGLSTQEIDDPNLEGLKQKITEGEEKILGQYNADLQLFVDLDLFSESFRADGVAVSSDLAFVLDKTGKKIIKITLSNKRTETLAGPADVQQANSFTAYSGRIFVSDSDGLYELNSGRIKVSEAEWGDALISAYAGNLYVLDKSGSKIYRYPATTSGFGAKSEWLRTGTQVEFSDARVIVIDGSVWVLTGEKKISKFTLGNLQNFTIQGVFPEIDNITDIFTNEESEFMYILEKDKGRVVVIAKDGEYKAQYLNETIKDSIKIIVSEREKKAFLLKNDKMLFIDLKHL